MHASRVDDEERAEVRVREGMREGMSNPGRGSPGSKGCTQAESTMRREQRCA